MKLLISTNFSDYFQSKDAEVKDVKDEYYYEADVGDLDYYLKCCYS